MVRGRRQMIPLLKLPCLSISKRGRNSTEFRHSFLLPSSENERSTKGISFCCVVLVFARQSQMTPQAVGQGFLRAPKEQMGGSAVVAVMCSSRTGHRVTRPRGLPISLWPGQMQDTRFCRSIAVEPTAMVTGRQSFHADRF